MASVLDNKSHPSVPGKVDGKLDLIDPGGLDGVRRVATLGATFGVKQRWRLASQANLRWAHNFDRVIRSKIELAGDLFAAD